MASFPIPLAGPLGGDDPTSAAEIPAQDPVALALSRLPQQYRGDDDEPTELLA